MKSYVDLFSWAGRNPGLRVLDTTPEEPSYVIFQGPVTPDQSSRVEVCVVISGPAEPEGSIVAQG